jgi:PilZ domain
VSAGALAFDAAPLAEWEVEMADVKPSAADAGSESYRNRRRSQRVQLTIPIIVRGSDGAAAFEEEAETISVSANGCLIRLKKRVTRGQQISIVNPKTAEELPCTITFLEQKESGKSEVGMEFSEASPLFWRIAFPPTDWDPTERKLPSTPRQTAKAR